MNNHDIKKFPFVFVVVALFSRVNIFSNPKERSDFYTGQAVRLYLRCIVSSTVASAITELYQ